MISGKLIFKANPNFPSVLKTAVKRSLERSALPLEISTKKLITNEKHIVTGRYRASINFNTVDGESRETSSASKSKDGHHDFKNNDMTLEVGTNVEYAGSLEKRYSLLSRGKETALPSMIKEFDKSLKQLLKEGK